MEESPINPPTMPDSRHKWRNVSLLAVAELLAMGLWFSASAVIPQLESEWRLDGSGKSWLTMSVQLGFVAGAMISAVLNLADRVDARRLFGLSAVAGAAFNAAIPLMDVDAEGALLLRFLTGVSLAGVYPPGMKLIATWCKEDRGLGIGILVGALTLGSALPHLLSALPDGGGGVPAWRPVLISTSALALLSAVISGLLIQKGPFLGQTAPFDWRYAGRAFRERATRLANFGYLGHMWELYAMWAWVPLFLIEAYDSAGWSSRGARIAGFSVIGVGAVGCVVAGKLGDRAGRTLVTSLSMAISGGCALIAGLFFTSPAVLTVICLIWGFAVVADSAQFSAAISELSDSRYVGTALTVQTSVGFLLTMLTIRIVPPVVDLIGWRYAFAVLAIGPAFGIWSMLRLRSLPEAARMASGNR